MAKKKVIPKKKPIVKKKPKIIEEIDEEIDDEEIDDEDEIDKDEIDEEEIDNEEIDNEEIKKKWKEGQGIDISDDPNELFEIEEEEIDEEEEIKEAIEEVKQAEEKKKKTVSKKNKKSKKESSIISFVIEATDLQKFIDDIRGKGFSSSSSVAIDLITDCILRIDKKNNQMWSIVVDTKRTFVAQRKQKITEVSGTGEIPIEIKELEKWLTTFDSDDVIKIIYENGIVALKNAVEKDIYKSNTNLTFLTKRKEAVSNDLLQNLEYGDETDQKNLKQLMQLGNSICKFDGDEKNHKCELFINVFLTNSFELPAKQLKKIIDDGERIGNRIYPFEFHSDHLKISVQSAEESTVDKIERTIIPKAYSINNEFNLKFASRLTNAVSNLSGILRMYVEDTYPMIIQSLQEKETDKELIYMVTTF